MLLLSRNELAGRSCISCAISSHIEMINTFQWDRVISPLWPMISLLLNFSQSSAPFVDDVNFSPRDDNFNSDQ